MKIHKILKPCQTRWLSLHSCIKQILEQLPALKLYFRGEYLLDNKTKEICEGINDPHFELYLNFLDYVLPLLNSLNIVCYSKTKNLRSMFCIQECLVPIKLF